MFAQHARGLYWLVWALLVPCNKKAVFYARGRADGRGVKPDAKQHQGPSAVYEPRTGRNYGKKIREEGTGRRYGKRVREENTGSGYGKKKQIRGQFNTGTIWGQYGKEREVTGTVREETGRIRGGSTPTLFPKAVIH